MRGKEIKVELSKVVLIPFKFLFNSSNSRILYSLGYTEVGEADGIAGKLFDKAMKRFQVDNGCFADGEATARCLTWKKLLGLA